MALPVGESNFRVLAIANARDAFERFPQLDHATEVWDMGERLKHTLVEEACLVETVKSWRWSEFVKALDELRDALNRVKTLDRREKRRGYREVRTKRAYLQDLSRALYSEFLREVEDLPVCVVTTRRRGVKSWIEVRRQFEPHEDIFDDLPDLARRDLQEAGWCFLFDQFTACAVLAMRAAECVLREYARRGLGTNAEKPERWNDLVERIEKNRAGLSDNLAVWLRAAKMERNSLAHPEKRLERDEWDKAEFFFDVAKYLSIELWEDLRRQGKA